MYVTHIKISPLDTGTGSRVVVYLTSANDGDVTGLGGVVWEPALVQAPTIGMALWNGDFTDAIDPGGATLPVNLNILRESYPGVEAYVWAGAPIEIRVGEPGDTWPWDVFFAGKIVSFSGNWPYLTLQAAVDTDPFAANVLNVFYLGTGGAEGGADLKGRPKPLVLGHAKNVEPLLIDGTNSVYQFSGYGAIEQVTTLYERGSEFPASSGDHADYAALVAATIIPGAWATCLAEGMIRLGAPAYGVPTGDILGHVEGSTTPRLTGAVINELADIAGVSASLIETASLSALDAAVPYPINIVITDQVSWLDIAKALVLPAGWQAGIGLTGTFFAAKPDLGGSEVITIDAQGAALPQIVQSEEIDVSPPYFKTIMAADRCWRVHTADEIAFNAVLVYRGLYDAAENYREGDWVDLIDGSTWVYINTTPGSGNDPPTWPTTSNAWWENRTPPLTTTIAGFLSNASHTVAADSGGTVADFTDAGGDFVVLEGNGIVSTGVTYSVVSETGVDVSINSTTGAYTVNSMSAASGTAVFRAVYSGRTIDLTYSIAKSIAGADGSGVKLLSVYATRLAISYDGTGAANPASQTNSFVAEKQNTTATVTWSVTDLNGTPRTPTTSYLSAATGDIVTMTVAQFAAAQNSTGGVIVTGTLTDGATLTDKVNVVKVQSGSDGTDGVDGPPAVGYAQQTSPGAGSFTNQLWYDTDDKILYRWVGSPTNLWARLHGDISDLDYIDTANLIGSAIATGSRGSNLSGIAITSADGWFPVMQNVGLSITDDCEVTAEILSQIGKNAPTFNDVFEWEWKVTRTSTANYSVSPVDVSPVINESYRYTGATTASNLTFDNTLSSMKADIGAQPTGLKYFHVMARCLTSGWGIYFLPGRRYLEVINKKRLP